MHIGVAHHFGWAVVVTATPDHAVVDRRRIDLVEPGVATAPIHHEGRELDDLSIATLVAEVRASAARAISHAFDELAAAVSEPIRSLSVRAWPADFPADLAVLRRPPYEARADSVMYLQVLVECGRSRGWDAYHFDARTVEAQATELLGDRGHDVLHQPRSTLGPPWNRDHRVALAATVLASRR